MKFNPFTTSTGSIGLCYRSLACRLRPPIKWKITGRKTHVSVNVISCVKALKIKLFKKWGGGKIAEPGRPPSSESAMAKNVIFGRFDLKWPWNDLRIVTQGRVAWPRMHVNPCTQFIGSLSWNRSLRVPSKLLQFTCFAAQLGQHWLRRYN